VSSQKIVVVTDSSAYIPEAAQGGLDIPVIPLWLIWGEERLRDRVDIDPPTFYRRLSLFSTPIPVRGSTPDCLIITC
jgi:fatty acid-binding protein DegV